MANEPKIKIDDLPAGEPGEMGEADLDGVVGGIKDGTSNTLMAGAKARLAVRPRPVMSDPDSGDEFV